MSALSLRSISAPIVASTVGDVIVSLVNAGDGYGERYDPTDREDVNFLRFTLARKHKGRVFDYPDFSRATLIPANTDIDILRRLADAVAKRVYPLADGTVRELEDACDDLAWIDPTWADSRIALDLNGAAKEHVAA